MLEQLRILGGVAAYYWWISSSLSEAAPHASWSSSAFWMELHYSLHGSAPGFLCGKVRFLDGGEGIHTVSSLIAGSKVHASAHRMVRPWLKVDTVEDAPTAATRRRSAARLAFLPIIDV